MIIICIISDVLLVVFHDYNLKRITGKNMIVEESTYEELNYKNIIHIPLLEEVLNLVNGKVFLLIEIKYSKKIGELETLLMNLLNNYKGEYAIQSFHPGVLLWFKKHYPNILRGQLSCSYLDKKMNLINKLLLKYMCFNCLTKPNFVSYKYKELSFKKILKYRKKGIRLLGGTVKTKEDYDFYIKYYDNLICEDFI